jgi:hypothetical protein
VPFGDLDLTLPCFHLTGFAFRGISVVGLYKRLRRTILVKIIGRHQILAHSDTKFAGNDRREGCPATMHAEDGHYLA